MPNLFGSFTISPYLREGNSVFHGLKTFTHSAFTLLFIAIELIPFTELL